MKGWSPAVRDAGKQRLCTVHDYHELFTHFRQRGASWVLANLTSCASLWVIAAGIYASTTNSPAQNHGDTRKQILPPLWVCSHPSIIMLCKVPISRWTAAGLGRWRRLLNISRAG